MPADYSWKDVCRRNAVDIDIESDPISSFDTSDPVTTHVQATLDRYRESSQSVDQDERAGRQRVAYPLVEYTVEEDDLRP